MENYINTISIIVSLIIIISIEVFSEKRRNWFIGFITKNKNGKLIPRPLLAYKENKNVFLRLSLPLIFVFSIEIIFTVILFKCLFGD